MYRFLLWRLAPFYVVALICEFVTFGVLLSVEQNLVDWSFLPMIKTIGVLLKTTTIAFIYLMLPYMTYLCFIPAAKINSPFDKNLTTIVYASFVFFMIFEESMSLVFWNKYSASFNNKAVEYMLDVNEVSSSLTHNYLFFGYILALFAITHLVMIKSKPFLWYPKQITGVGKRIFYWVVYAVCCAMIFVNFNDSELKINENIINNELSKGGTYSLVSAFWHSKSWYFKLHLLK